MTDPGMLEEAAARFHPATAPPSSATPRPWVWMGIRAGLVVCCIALTLAGRVPTALAAHRYSSDPFFFAYVAIRWLHGIIPYTQIWDIKPPGVYLVGRVVFSLFYKSFIAIAAVETGFLLGAIAIVYELLRQAGASRFPRVVGTLMAALAVNLMRYNDGGFMTELYLILPAALSILCCLRALQGGRLSGWMWVAGLCSGCAVLFKTVGVASFFAEVAFLAVLSSQGVLQPLRALRGAAAASLGLITPWIPVLVYFRAHAATASLLRATFPWGYASSRWAHPLGVLWSSLGAMSLLGSMLACAPIVAAYAIRRYHRGRDLGDRRTKFCLLILLWFVAEFTCALATGRNYDHYYVPVMLPMALLGGLASWFLSEDAQGALAARIALATLLLTPLFLPFSQDLYLEYLMVRHRGADSSPEARIADYLEKAKSGNDTLFVWDYQPYIYYRTEMPCPSRFIFGETLDTRPQDVAEQARTLTTTPATYVVASDKNLDSGTELDSKLSPFLRQHYLAVYQAAPLVVYRWAK